MAIKGKTPAQEAARRASTAFAVLLVIVVIITPMVLLAGFIANYKGIELPSILEYALFACIAAILLAVNFWRHRVKCPDCGGNVLENYLIEKSSTTGKDLMSSNQIRSNCADCGRSFSEPYVDPQNAQNRPIAPPNDT